MKIVEFGDPLLRAPSIQLNVSEIKSTKTKKLIKNMHDFLESKKSGVGLAAVQLGELKSIAILRVRAKPYRKVVREFDLTMINPEIVQVYGRRIQLMEGCISAGSTKGGLFANVPRYKRVKVKYFDESGKKSLKIFEELPAQIIQHEIDHLNGILFVDRVKDTKSYITYGQYKKMMKSDISK